MEALPSSASHATISVYVSESEVIFYLASQARDMQRGGSVSRQGVRVSAMLNKPSHDFALERNIE
jgi:hypothetical protein